MWYPVTRESALKTVGCGWHNLINTLYDLKPEGVNVLQVKEKFGELRFYIALPYDKTDEDIFFDYQNLVDDLCAISARVCEECGALGKTVETSRGWLLTLCNRCTTKTNSLET